MHARFFTSIIAAVFLITALAPLDASAKKKKSKKKPPAAATTPAPAPAPAAAAPAAEAAPAPAEKSVWDGEMPDWAKKDSSSSTATPAATTTPAEPAPAPAAEAETEIAVDKKDPAVKSIDIAVGVRGFRRSLSFSGDPEARFANYKVPGSGVPVVPELALDVGYYPWRYLGFVADLSYASLKTRGFDGDLYKTSAYGGSLGARARLPLDGADIGAVVLFGLQGFSIGTPAATGDNPIVVSTQYVFARPGISGRVRVHELVDVLAKGSYLAVLASGDLKGEYFPESGGSGFDIGAGAAMPIIAGTEARLWFDLRRYSFALNPKSGAAYLAKNAVDLYFGLTLQLGFRA